MQTGSLLQSLMVSILLMIPSSYFTIPGNTNGQKTGWGTTLRFPADHFQHPGFLTEWWYINGHLETKSGKKFAYAFSLFRASPLLYFSHLSLTDLATGEFTFDRIYYPARQVRANRDEALISYGNEQVLTRTGVHDFQVRGTWKDISITFFLKSERIPMLVNGNAKIDMPEGGLSHYYSLTRLSTQGWITKGNQTMRVSGTSWIDHQWGNFYVRKSSWDWFSFQMDDSTDYNLYSFRNRNDRTTKQFINVLDTNGSLSSSEQMFIKRTTTWKNPRTGRHFVTGWELILPARKDTFYVKARHRDQEIFVLEGRDFFPSYWEGSCEVEKRTADGRRILGTGFSEHFPYRK
jgi:predicted secreted hydrolase